MNIFTTLCCFSDPVSNAGQYRLWMVERLRTLGLKNSRKQIDLSPVATRWLSRICHMFAAVA